MYFSLATSMGRVLCLYLLLLVPTGWASAAESDHSMWVEPNFVDTQYSALLRSLRVTKAGTDDKIFEHVPFGWIPYYVDAEVIDVYKGDLERAESIEILVYLSALSAGHQLKKISNRFILSFCKSDSRIYYTSRDFLIQSPTAANIERFEMVREHGSEYEGTGDCDGNYPSLDPDNHI